MSATVSLLTANARRILRRPFLDNNGAHKPAMQDSSWADGLRGIAAVYVVCSHMVLCFARRLVTPCCTDNGSIAFFQLPILRLVAQGHSWVAVFFLLSGFVNALKPIKLARAGQHETALANMAVSSFRRTFRLMLPATTATLLSWSICQLGAYETARNSDAYWLYTYTPHPSQSWGTALEDLVQGFRDTWTFGVDNQYDQPQWALIYLLEGSMMVFCALLVTIKLTPFWRVVSLVVFALWSFDWSYQFRDPLVGYTVFSGIIFADIYHSDLPSWLQAYSPFLSPPLTIIALVLMSYPNDASQMTRWTTFLYNLGPKIFPKQSDLGRTWGSTGGVLLILAILPSPHLRRFLAHPFLLWLGKLSFPIYLLHGTFMRSVFAWMMFAGKALAPFEIPEGDDKKRTVMRYPLPGSMWTAFSVIVSMSFMLLGAHLWASNVEPLLGTITKKAEDLMTGTGSGSGNGTNSGAGDGRPLLPVRKE